MLIRFSTRLPAGRQGFTLVELIVVISIIAVIAAATTFSYRTSLVSSRNARRKSDLEQIRAAIELYKSNNNIYPASLAADMCNTGALTDGASNTYMSAVPEDPKCTGQNYYYAQLSAGADYTLGSMLEAPGSSTCTVVVDCSSLAGTQNCNYCVGPYGQK